ncbi:MAG: type 4a pilus biogenesis protein PilO [Methylococcales bacterium]|jgi:type IV pilus assembly protein PilO|nr:type 4a pilus biogenesis protein PilO [Methylococcales bacterium]MBT7443562.1 type 4a pilus biogenesis protein PilO [Methylococcales bacterium]
MELSDLNDLDFNNAGNWPIAAKIATLVLIAALVCGGVYYFDTQHQIVDLEKLHKSERDLKNEFAGKQRKAANLEALRRQLAEMEEILHDLLRQLPKTTKMDDLIVDTSQTGLASGLESDLFDPQGEVRKEFYVEVPVKIKVVGKYHEFGNFVSGLAVLPRIVTIHGIHIRGFDKVAETGGNLTMEAVAKTYRYVEEDE